jgi:hypothetical protein
MSMTDTHDMLEASRVRLAVGADELAVAIDACFACVQACTGCADSDLVEDDVATLRTCIALNHACADICDTSARVLSRPARWDLTTGRLLLRACVRACMVCAEECARHAMHHHHCAICEAACRVCIQACTALLEAECLQASPMSDFGTK